MRKRRSLSDLYLFPGFRPYKTLHGLFGDSNARVIKLNRRGEKLFAAYAVQLIGPLVIVESALSVICPLAAPEFTSSWRFAESSVAGAVR